MTLKDRLQLLRDARRMAYRNGRHDTPLKKGWLIITYFGLGDYQDYRVAYQANEGEHAQLILRAKRLNKAELLAIAGWIEAERL